MASTAQYVATPKIGSALVNTAESSFTAPTNASAVFTAGASGSRIDQINLAGAGTTIASQVRLYIYDGTNYSFLRDVSVSAITPSNSQSAFNSYLCSQTNPEILPILLPTGYSLRVAVSAAQTGGNGIRVTASGGDF
jgi:hypothetical protein